MIQFTSHYSGSKGNLYSITDGKTSLLLDPGVPIMKIKQALNFKLSGINGCLVSHEHLDHSCSASDIAVNGIDLYAGHPTIEALGLSHHRIHDIILNIPLKIGTWYIRTLPVPHDVPNLAFHMSSKDHKCLFMIDALYCPYLFGGLTHIFLGINYDSDILKRNVKSGRIHPGLAIRIMQSHCSLKTALQFFKDQDLSRIEEIHVLHCSEANLDKDKAKEAIQRVSGKLVVI